MQGPYQSMRRHGSGPPNDNSSLLEHTNQGHNADRERILLPEKQRLCMDRYPVDDTNHGIVTTLTVELRRSTAATFVTALGNPALRTSCWIVSTCEGDGSLDCDGTSAHEVEPAGSTIGERLANHSFCGQNEATRINESPVESKTLDKTCRRRVKGGKV